MYDYWKVWIKDPAQIETILGIEAIKKDYTCNEDGKLIGISGTLKGWKLQTLSPCLLEIAGSIHKDWNGGTNENDFTFSNAIEAIDTFCKDFQLNPALAYVKNLEFGINLQLPINASEIIDQILCFDNLQPLRPYDSNPEYYFIEFQRDEYFLKVYDKGKQYRKDLPLTPNTLRIEVKAMKNRALPNIETLADLRQIENLQVLGVKFAKLLKGLAFEDDTLQPKELNREDRKLYRQLSNPRKWKQFRGNTTTGSRKRVTRFKHIIETYGKRKIYSLITEAVNAKLAYLLQTDNVAVFTPNTYTVKTDINRACLSCGKDITNQHRNSRFCSAKYVGERAAKKCRNSNSNPRNNRQRKIDKINSKGVLFDVSPFVIERKKRA